MPEKTLVLIGIRGHVTGEIFILEPGRTYAVGRSRACDISLRKLTAWKSRSEDERKADQDFLTVSGRHFTIAVESTGTATVNDLSSNGTFLDSRRMNAPMTLTDLLEREHFIRFGTQEEMVLKTRTVEG